MALQPDQGCDISVDFKPGAPGPFACDVVILRDAARTTTPAAATVAVEEVAVVTGVHRAFTRFAACRTASR
jgi:hypothetical protein